MSDSFEKNTNVLAQAGNLGEVKISDEAIAVIAGIAATEIEGVDSMAGGITAELVGKLGLKNLSKGVKVEIVENAVNVDISLNIRYGFNIPDVSAKVQEKVKASVESMTGLKVPAVKVRVAGVSVPEA